MKTRPDIEQKLEDALNSLDGIRRAEPRPFFYTRVMGRLERQDRSVWESIGGFLAKPVVAIAGLCLILALNVVALTRDDSSSLTSSSETQVPDNEYILASSNSSFDYENIDQ